MPHQRQEPAPADLRLPDMRQFVDEQALQIERLGREIGRPAAVVGVEMNMPHRRHHDPARLERPPFAVDHPDARIIDRVAEHRSRQRDFAWSEGPLERHRAHLTCITANRNPACRRRPASLGQPQY